MTDDLEHYETLHNWALSLEERRTSLEELESAAQTLYLAGKRAISIGFGLILVNAVLIALNLGLWR